MQGSTLKYSHVYNNMFSADHQLVQARNDDIDLHTDCMLKLIS